MRTGSVQKVSESSGVGSEASTAESMADAHRDPES